MKDHEYALLDGVNRSKVGRYLGSLAAMIAGVVVFVLLHFVDVSLLGIPPRLASIVLSMAGGAVVYAAIYWVFSRYALNYRHLQSLLQVPNLSGEWRCVGKTMATPTTPARDWEGTLTIVQSWDRIRVRLKTAQSGSNSIAAALAYDSIDGYRLLYNYINEPRADQAELAIHRGWADLSFSKDLKSARGEYFNGQGRWTYGTMEMTRN